MEQLESEKLKIKKEHKLRNNRRPCQC